jgi:translation initiation factor IF-3
MRFAADLAPHGSVEALPRLEGRNAHILISPLKSAAKPGEKPAGGDKPPAAPAAKPGEKPPVPPAAKPGEK